MAYANTQRTKYTDTEAPTESVEQQWEQTVNGEPASELLVANGHVYLGTVVGRIFGLDATSGGQQWNYLTTDYAGVVEGLATPSFADGSVYGSSSRGERHYSVDAGSGNSQWNFGASFEEPSSHSPAVTETTGFFADQSLRAIDTESGEQQWRGEKDAEDNLPNTLVAAGGGKVVVGIEEDTLGDDEKWMNVYDESTGEKISQIDRHTETPVVADGALLYPWAGGRMAFDLETSEKRWDVEGPEQGLPTVIGDTACFPTSEGIIGADIATGERLWQYSTDGSYPSFLTGAGDTLVFATSTPDEMFIRLHAVDARTQSELWQTRIRAGRASALAVADGYIYVQSRPDIYEQSTTVRAYAAP